MTSETMELEIPTSVWHSPGDEESFFRWLYSIKGYVTCEGRGRTLYVTISLADVDRSSVQELVAIFRRYEVPNMQQLRALQRSKIGKWFADPDKYWHSAIFS